MSHPATASVAPPTPQESHASSPCTRPSPKKPAAPVSGTESDSDSVLTPDYVPPSPGVAAFMAGSSSQTPLSAIAERRSHSGGEEDSEEEEDAEAQWKGKERGGVDDSVIKSGYLWKKGERRKTWKKRWFVLRSSHLAYYKTSAEYRLLRLLDLTEVHACIAVALKKHENSFGVVSPTRTFYLQAETQTSVQEWVALINETREKNNLTSTANSVVSVAGNSVDSVTITPSGPSQPIAIPGRKSNVAYPPIIATPALSQSPQRHAVTSSESEDTSNYSPNRHARTRSQSSTTQPQQPASPRLPAVTHSPSKAGGVAGQQDWDPTRVVLTGYLMKCGSKRRNWRKRWFVLSGEKLVYSGSHMDTKPHRELPLSQFLDALEYDLPQQQHRSVATTSPPGPAISQSFGSALSPSEHEGDAQHTFKIVTTKRTLLLCAPSEEEEIKWLSAVRALIARRPGAAGGGPGTATEGGTAGLETPHAPAHSHAPSASASGGSGFSATSAIRGTVRRLSVTASATPRFEDTEKKT